MPTCTWIKGRFIPTSGSLFRACMGIFPDCLIFFVFVPEQTLTCYELLQHGHREK